MHSILIMLVIFYETSKQKGKYWTGKKDVKAQELDKLAIPAQAWYSSLAQLYALAIQSAASSDL